MASARGMAVVDTVPYLFPKYHSYISPFTPYSICFNTIIILLYSVLAAWDPVNIQRKPIENHYRKDNNYELFGRISRNYEE